MRQMLADNGHRPPVGLKEEIRPLHLAGLIRVFQGEHPVGNDAEIHAASNFHPPLEWLLYDRQIKLAFVKKPDAMLPTGKLKGHHDLGNQKRVFKKHLADGAVLLAP